MFARSPACRAAERGPSAHLPFSDDSSKWPCRQPGYASDCLRFMKLRITSAVELILIISRQLRTWSRFGGTCSTDFPKTVPFFTK